MRTAFAEAAAAVPGELHEARLRLVGRPAIYRIVGDELARRTLAPLSHLIEPRDRDEPVLVAELWDEHISGVPLPLERPDRGIGSDGGAVVWHADEGVMTILDRSDGVIVGWRARADAAPEEVWRSLPWTLPVWFIDNAASIVHAGLVTDGEHGALVVGEGGSGKSTTCLACAAAGLGFLGDDFVALEETADGFIGHSISGVARVEHGIIDRHPELALGTQPTEAEGKAMVQLAEVADLHRSVTVDLILLPRLGSGSTRRLRASPGEALAAFLPSTLMLTLGGGQLGMNRLARLTRAAPAQALEIGGAPAEAAAAVASALEELGA
jgi:hypothetical protein